LIKQCSDIVDPLAKRYAAKYEKLILTEEDYQQEGLIALLRTAEEYDSEKGSFHHFARRVIRNAFLDAIRKVYPHIHFVVYDENRDSLEENSDSEEAEDENERINMQIRSTYDSNPERIYLQKERLQELHSAMNTLSTREDTWVRWRYGFVDEEPHSLAESARKYNMTESWAGILEKKALKKMRHEMTR
jgi:RNA polymerase primary sigma factor/RNA polymerase sporulation-specific sigma factor